MKNLKKGSSIFIILGLIIFILVSTKFHLNKKKPNNFYYTNLLAKNLTLCTNHKITILDTNFYKTKDLCKEDVKTLKNFLKELRKPNFVAKPISLNTKPKYKIFFSFKGDSNENKYVINIYDDKYISTYPWDGNWEMDYINTKTIPQRFNLYSLCKNTFGEN